MSASGVSENRQRASELVARDWRMLIGGSLVAPGDGTTYATSNPATGEHLADAPFAGPRDIDRAVEAADAASAGWAGLSLFERIRCVMDAAAIVRRYASELALLDSIDSGNPISAMLADAHTAASIMSYFAGIAPEVKGSTVPSSARNLHFTLREPFGVVGRITPSNRTVLFAAAKCVAPLLMGNTLILKAPDQTPLAPLYLAELLIDVFPPGVLNVVSGDGSTTGEALIEHPRVKRIAITGSRSTGMRVQAVAAAVGVKRVSLELGGKNPMIVFPDADLSAAVDGALAGMNFSVTAGQSCGSTSRLFVHASIHDEFVSLLRERVSKIRVGDPLDPHTEMGCLVSRQQYERVMSAIASGTREGARLLIGGGRPPEMTSQNGFFVAPTIFDRVRDEMRVASDEIFGPVVSILTWNDVDEAITRANSLTYGLTAAVWTRDIDTAFRAARSLDAGYVWVNGSSQHFAGMPFGGHKESGTDYEESIDELLGFTELKSINVMTGSQSNSVTTGAI